MAKRITIMIDDDLDAKIRKRQAKLISTQSKSVSFSHVINAILRGEVKL
jgi:hypothetical protein